MSEMTLKQHRDAYFAESGFDTSSYTDRWVEVRIGKLLLRAPNTAARRALVAQHDLHHALTGYKADLAGEAEIGAWEVASGLRGSATGYYLDLTAMGWGMLIAPRRTWRAFVRGRHSQRKNLYYRPDFASLVPRPVSEARTAVNLATGSASASLGDRGVFVVALVGAVVSLAVTALTVPFALLLGLLPAERKTSAVV